MHGRRPCLRLQVGSGSGGSGGSKLHGTGGKEGSQLASRGRIILHWCVLPSSTPQTRYQARGAGSDGLRLSHLQSTISTGFGREKFGAGIDTLWRRIFDDPGAFPPNFWQLFLQSNRTAFGGKRRPV